MLFQSGIFHPPPVVFESSGCSSSLPTLEIFCLFHHCGGPDSTGSYIQSGCPRSGRWVAVRFGEPGAPPPDCTWYPFPRAFSDPGRCIKTLSENNTVAGLGLSASFQPEIPALKGHGKETGKFGCLRGQAYVGSPEDTRKQRQ